MGPPIFQSSYIHLSDELDRANEPIIIECARRHFFEFYTRAVDFLEPWTSSVLLQWAIPPERRADMSPSELLSLQVVEVVDVQIRCLRVLFTRDVTGNSPIRNPSIPQVPLNISRYEGPVPAGETEHSDDREYINYWPVYRMVSVSQLSKNMSNKGRVFT